MSSKAEKQHLTPHVAKCFKSPLFLVIAICLSVMLIATFITVLTADLGFLFVLGLIFLIVSTIAAWLLYAGEFGKGKMKNLRLYIAYSKIMNTIAIVLVSIVGAILVAGCVILTLMSDMIVNEVVPMLEEEVKPILEEVVAMSDEIEQDMDSIEELFEELPQEIKDTYGINTVEDMLALVTSLSQYAEKALDAWDDIIEVLTAGFLTLTIIVAVVFVVLIVALCFVSSGLKKTSKYIKAFANDVDTDKKAPVVASFGGGAVMIVGGILAFVVSMPVGITLALQGAVVIMFSVFFKQLKEARKLDDEMDDDAVEDDAPVAETVAE